MLTEAVEKISNINRLSQIKLPLLFFGLAIWVIVPIVGILPLLLFVQLDLLQYRSKKKKILSLNNLILLLVILTIAIYVSSFDIFGDTQNYLKIYQTLDTEGPFDNYFSSDRYEFVLFIVLDLFHKLTNGSPYLCLFLFSLLINCLVVFYISKKLSAKYYPTLLILLFANYSYYSHIFYMRQALSIVLVMAAIVTMESNFLLFLGLGLLAIFSHITTTIYFLLALLVKFYFWSSSSLSIQWKNKNNLLLYFALGILTVSLGYTATKVYSNPEAIYGYIGRLLDVFPEQELGSSLQKTVENYDGRDSDTFGITPYYLLSILTIIFFIIVRNYKKVSPKIITLIGIFALSILQIVFILATGFNYRIVYLFLALYGLFFSIGLDENNSIKPLGIFSSITLVTVAANVYNFINIQSVMVDKSGWSFFEGQPLTVSLPEYISFFWNSIY
ncbi:MAG: hypothetical protein Tsb0014_20810 [Pleurocapsa sp.]